MSKNARPLSGIAANMSAEDIEQLRALAPQPTRKRRKPRERRKSIDSGSGKGGNDKYTKHLHLDQATRVAWAKRGAEERARAKALNGPVTVRKIGDPP